LHSFLEVIARHTLIDIAQSRLAVLPHGPKIEAAKTGQGAIDAAAQEPAVAQRQSIESASVW
jgi:hypothetical protein